MTMIRYGIALLLAICVAIGLFAMMNYLIMDTSKPVAEPEEPRIVDFIRVQREKQTRERTPERPTVPPPLLDTPPMEFAKAGQRPDVPEINVDIPDMNIDMDLSFGEMGRLVAASLASKANIVNPATTGATTRGAVAITAFPPQYPQRAARNRIEGHVVVEFTVSKTGSVEDISVVESSPRRIFDEAAMRAISRYTFMPALVDGKPAVSKARQRIDFQI